jgi:predicted ATPase
VNLSDYVLEIETLLGVFNRVAARGTPELMLVSGYSGIGKPSTNRGC